MDVIIEGLNFLAEEVVMIQELELRSFDSSPLVTTQIALVGFRTRMLIKLYNLQQF
ncbi:MAG: hypothetical protein V7L23_12170 [Nostoc sp.]|uniref:hypothetical protein n=1 Tax=Nostoc sp. TaxID=1180 RepID=UPI002FF2705C